MRDKRTPDEAWAIQKLMSHLQEAEPGWTQDESVTDKPDLVLENPEGLCVACELSTVGIQEWHRWQNDRGLQLDVDQLDCWVLPREPDIWLAEVIARKNPCVPSYVDNSGASEVWLLVHSSQSKPHDFFVLDEDYDLPLMQAAASSAHSFTRIYVVGSTAGVARVWPTNPAIGAPPALGPGTLKALVVRSIRKSAAGGRVPVAIGSEFRPDRQIVLPALDRTRMSNP